MYQRGRRALCHIVLASFSCLFHLNRHMDYRNCWFVQELVKSAGSVCLPDEFAVSRPHVTVALLHRGRKFSSQIRSLISSLLLSRRSEYLVEMPSGA